MTSRSPARLLAPIALVAVAVALVVVVTGAGGAEGGAPASASPKPTATSKPTRGSSASKRKSSRASKGRRSYTVKSGDTPSGIADSTGVTVAQLIELNPDLDSQSLSVGQRVKLR